MEESLRPDTVMQSPVCSGWPPKTWTTPATEQVYAAASCQKEAKQGSGASQQKSELTSADHASDSTRQSPAFEDGCTPVAAANTGAKLDAPLICYKGKAAEAALPLILEDRVVPVRGSQGSNHRCPDSPPFPIQDLPECLLGSILEAVSMRSSTLTHMLVCRWWRDITIWAQIHVEVRQGALVSDDELLSSLSTFPRLKSLRLNRSSVIHLAPTFLTQLTQQCRLLTHLHMDNITGQLDLLPPDPSSSRLKYLFLHGRQVPQWVGSLRSPSHLELKGCTSMPSSFGSDLVSLRRLSMECAQVDSFPPSAAQMTSLKALSLTLYAQTQLPASLGHFANFLERLTLACPCVNAPEGLTGMCFLRGLRKLNICAGPKLCSLPLAVGNLQKLESFALRRPKDDSRLGSSEDISGALRLPSTFWHLKNLRKLRLEGLSVGEMLLGLGSLGALEILVLSRCGTQKLPADVAQMKSLRWLRVHRCPRLLELPAGIWKLPCLRGALLNGNPIPSP